MSSSRRRMTILGLVVLLLGIAWSVAHHAPVSVSSQSTLILSVSHVPNEGSDNAAVTALIPGQNIVPGQAPDQVAIKEQESVPVSPMPIPTPNALERLIVDTSPIPTGGKPVAQVEVTWRIRVREDGTQTFSGVLECTPRSKATELNVRFSAVDGAALISPEAPSGVEAHVNEMRSFPLGGTFNNGTGAVVAIITMRGYDVRSRVVRVDLSRERVAPGGVLKPEPGVEMITDSRGGSTLLMPAVTPPPTTKP